MRVDWMRAHNWAKSVIEYADKTYGIPYSDEERETSIIRHTLINALRQLGAEAEDTEQAQALLTDLAARSWDKGWAAAEDFRVRP